MHEYTIELRIEGKDLNFDEISKELNLNASFLRSEHEVPLFIWGYDGSDKYDSPIYWESFEEGFCFLLEKLAPVKSKLEKYNSKNEVYFWCGHFQSSFDGGPTFSKELLKLLADFEVEVYIDNYFSDK